MTRQYRSTRKFEKQFQQLDNKTSKQAAKAIDLFISEPSRPTLRFKKIQGTDNLYKICVNMSVRIIIEVTSKKNDQINTLYIIGTHDEVFPPK